MAETFLLFFFLPFLLGLGVELVGLGNAPKLLLLLKLVVVVVVAFSGDEGRER